MSELRHHRRWWWLTGPKAVVEKQVSYCFTTLKASGPVLLITLTT